MTNKDEKVIIQKIRSAYEEKSTQRTKLDELKALDKQVKTKPRVFAYIYGIVGSLVLGVGMCLAMEIIGSIIPLGIVIGLIGIVMISTTYSIYNKILISRKKKYSSEIISLSDELLNKK